MKMSGLSYCAALFGLVLTACGAHREPPAAPAAKATSTQTGALRPATKNIAVSSEIAERCGLVVGKVGKAESAPKFDFDRSDLAPEDREILRQVALCVTSGPLKGHGLRLIGHTDPRGETEYNLALGVHRADSARDVLVQQGVDKVKVAESSRGELDANGKDEDGWRRDRRVDIVLL
jgi:peptidoglycan-associated lipoprotein